MRSQLLKKEGCVKQKILTKIFEISWTVILNLVQDLTPWTKRDAEPIPKQVRHKVLTTIVSKKLEENSQI